MARTSNSLWPQERGKLGAESIRRTKHNALLCAMSQIHFRSDWWQYNYALSCAYCLLCSRPISETIGVTDQMFLQVELHEHRHVEALGTEKVAAAEALMKLLQYGTGPTVRILIEDVWGCIPNVRLSEQTNTTTKGPQP